MAARLRQIQLLLVPDSPAGHARRPRVRLQPGGDARDCAVDRPGAVLRRSDRAGIRAGVAVVAVVRGADSQSEGAVSVPTRERVVADPVGVRNESHHVLSSCQSFTRYLSYPAATSASNAV